MTDSCRVGTVIIAVAYSDCGAFVLSALDVYKGHIHGTYVRMVINAGIMG